MALSKFINTLPENFNKGDNCKVKGAKNICNFNLFIGPVNLTVFLYNNLISFSRNIKCESNS